MIFLDCNYFIVCLCNDVDHLMQFTPIMSVWL